jgi:sterol desaturase/sphingolipid hydroxylase (fatty acid hydroxylase superfamily)
VMSAESSAVVPVAYVSSLNVANDPSVELTQQSNNLPANSLPANSLQKMLEWACYPLLWLIASTVVWATFTYELEFGLVNVVFLFFVIAYLALFERLIPYDVTWQATKKEWLRDGIYLFITMMGGALSIVAIFAVASVVSPKTPSLPLGVEIVLAILFISFGSYVFHRLGHDWPWLWRFHGIHHAEAKVNVGNNSVNHIFDVWGRRFIAQLPLIFIGISEQSLFVVSIFNTLQGYFVHANVNVRLGRLNYFIGSPEQHRLHHSVDIKEAGHFCVDVTLWDWIFGSYFWRKGRKPDAVGIKNPARFPPPEAIFKCFIHPFKKPK